jgi:hypothetical protein
MGRFFQHRWMRGTTVCNNFLLTLTIHIEAIDD